MLQHVLLLVTNRLVLAWRAHCGLERDLTRGTGPTLYRCQRSPTRSSVIWTVLPQ